MREIQGGLDVAVGGAPSSSMEFERPGSTVNARILTIPRLVASLPALRMKGFGDGFKPPLPARGGGGRQTAFCTEAT